MRRGQVAMEFIMTYGWAILAVLVAIGALAYFGVLSPQRAIPERCILETGFNCRDFIVEEEDANLMQVRFTVLNGLGEGVRISETGTSAQIRGSGNSVPCDHPITFAVENPVLIGGGDQLGFTCVNVPGNPGEGQLARLEISLNYSLATGTYWKVTTGELTARVQ